MMLQRFIENNRITNDSNKNLKDIYLYMLDYQLIMDTLKSLKTKLY